MINPVKSAVLVLLASYWVVVVGVLLVARPVYDQLLDQRVRVSGDHRPAEIATLAVLTALLSLLSIGIVRGWRWTFWLILIVFLLGLLRVPQVALELVGKVPSQPPTWFALLTAVVGLIQFGIAVAMVVGYRRAGVWGSS